MNCFVENCCSVFNGDIRFASATYGIGCCSLVKGNVYYDGACIANAGCAIQHMTYSCSGIILPDVLNVTYPLVGAMAYDYVACALVTYDGAYWV